MVEANGEVINHLAKVMLGWARDLAGGFWVQPPPEIPTPDNLLSVDCFRDACVLSKHPHDAGRGSGTYATRRRIQTSLNDGRHQSRHQPPPYAFGAANTSVRDALVKAMLKIGAARRKRGRK